MGIMELTTDKIYRFPTELEKVKFEDHILIINKQGCNWLVFSDETYSIFEELRNGASIEAAMKKYGEENVIEVITQIEAKQFEDTEEAIMDEKNLFIYLTNRCNLRCKHCYMYSGNIDLNELDYTVWDCALSDFRKEGMESVTFSGGELLVYPNWQKILHKAKELGYLVTVLSNGIMWNDIEIEKIFCDIDEIQFSLDGYDEESYQKVRGYDGFHKVLDVAEKFSQKGTRVSIAVTPLFEGLDKFVECFTPFAKAYLNEHPEIFIRFNMELIEGRDVQITEEQNREYRDKVRAMVNQIYPDYYKNTFHYNYEGRKRIANCGYGGITIAADGRIFWCNRIMELDSTMSIEHNSVEEIMEQSLLNKKRTSIDKIKPCNQCAIKYVCGGKCRLKCKKLEDGTLESVCSREDKELFYHKMIVSNEYFYSE